MFDARVTEREEIQPQPDRQYTMREIVKAMFSAISTKIKFEFFLLTRHPKLALDYKMRKIPPLFSYPEKTPEILDKEAFDKLTYKLLLALEKYELKTYNGEIILFNAMKEYFFVDADNKILYKELPVDREAKLAWKKYADSIMNYDVEGEHSTIFVRENAREFAEILQQYLDKSTEVDGVIVKTTVHEQQIVTNI